MKRAECSSLKRMQGWPYLYGCALSVFLATGNGCKDAVPAAPESPYSGPPMVEFTHIPAYRSHDNLLGRARGMDPATHYVAVYIYVEGVGWWIKPYFAFPRTDIRSDASWTCDVTTGGIDEYATRFSAFVLPDTVSAPLSGGSAALPPILDTLSVARVSVVRSPG